MIPIHNNIVSDAVAEFIVTDMQNPDIVEGQGFQRLIAVLRLVVFRCVKLESIKRFNRVKASVKSTF